MCFWFLSCHFFPTGTTRPLNCHFLLDIKGPLLLQVGCIAVFVIYRNLQSFLIQLIGAASCSPWNMLFKFFEFLKIFFHFFGLKLLFKLSLSLAGVAEGFLALFTCLVYFLNLLCSIYMIIYMGLSSRELA